MTEGHESGTVLVYFCDSVAELKKDESIDSIDWSIEIAAHQFCTPYAFYLLIHSVSTRWRLCCVEL
jgi:hypothetical protein